jgi:death on curing protein
MSGVEPNWIDLPEVIALHDRLLALHGGASGVREEGLLHSALARPRQRANYDENADVVDLAVAYTAGIVRNHPFVDGNKRTGFLIGILFLELNGYRFTAPESATTNAVLELAAGTLDEAGYTMFVRANVEREAPA